MVRADTNYIKEPPAVFTNNKRVLTQVRLIITVYDILNINIVDSTFTVIFK